MFVIPKLCTHSRNVPITAISMESSYVHIHTCQNSTHIYLSLSLPFMQCKTKAIIHCWLCKAGFKTLHCITFIVYYIIVVTTNGFLKYSNVFNVLTQTLSSLIAEAIFFNQLDTIRETLNSWFEEFFFLKIFLKDICPFCGATDTPVLDFWWHLVPMVIFLYTSNTGCVCYT